ncbi:MAG: SpoIID/LytB domain-containing protein [Nitrospira sp.]|nr:SpoIID/LytB domain-containing protein [Nitrospira sp.]MCP9442756.1 SpoIID/LytB domain-containing protein [Nitrospira sp.]
MNQPFRACLIGVIGLATGALDVVASPAYAAPAIRVLLAADVQQLDARATHVLWVTDASGGARSYRNAKIRIERRGLLLFVNGTRMDGDQITLRTGKQDLAIWLPQPGGQDKQPIFPPADDPPTWHINGLVQVIMRGGGLLVVNHVDLEEYVKGVLPGEVNSSWHPEMLKAQAVAARTYALYHHMLSGSRDYDVAAGTQDQVYRGRRGVDARVEQAVDSTKGEVVTYEDAPIYAAFSSTAAGLTEDAAVVWAKDLPYLKGVECPFDLESPYFQWKTSFKVETLERNLRQQGFDVGAIATLAPLSYSRSGRVATLRVLHSKGELILRGEELRKAVGYTVVPSTQFTIESFGEEVVLSGYGAGHAVGLCQWGAKELAELGYSYASILRYYYPGTELRSASLTKAPPVPPVVATPAF